MSAAAPPTLRAAEDQLLCVSGTHPPPHAYLCVPAAASTARGVWDACASCAVAIRDGASAVAPANPRPPGLALAGPTPPEPEPPEPPRLRPTLLGKRAFSPQPSSAPPACPSLPKAPPTMPTNQPPPWQGRPPWGDRDGPTAPPRPRRVSAPASLSAPGRYGDPTLSRESEPVPQRWPDFSTAGRDVLLDRSSQPATQNLTPGGPCGPVGWQPIENANAVDTYEVNNPKLPISASHLKPGAASGADSDSALAPSRLVSLLPLPSSPPSSPLPPRLAPGAEEPCPVPMDTSSAPCVDGGVCVCSVPCSAAVGRRGSGSGDGVSPDRLSVCSVTTQISSIHLTKQSRDRAGGPSSPDPALPEPGSPQSQQAVAALSDCGEEEELAGKQESQCSGDDDDGSEVSTLSDASTLMLALSNVDDCRTEKPALVPSLFPSTPPTLYFSTANERVEMLPPEQSRLLKWKMSTVTPNVVKHTLARSHFKPTKNAHDWLGCWGHHMRSVGFRAIFEHQKLNHFPGSFQIGRKDRLWRNLYKMQLLFGRREFSFFPQSFVLPQDMKLLRKAWEESGRLKWIIKPPASARGNGIQVINRWSQLPRRRPLLVQRYLHKPFLIEGSKFDLRIYVYVSSFDPLRIYVFSDGLVRFASCKYSSSTKNLSNKFMHLTNYSVNKKNSEYQSNDDDQSCQGHKWTLKALWQYLDRKGANTSRIWEKIKDIVIKTVIVADPYVNKAMQTHVRSAYCCHELFGFDIMLDENLKPWLLEVNISPSLHSRSALDARVKGQMVRDVLNLAGFLLPQQGAVDAAESTSSSVCAEVQASVGLESLAPDERAKRAHYESQRFADQEFLSSVLDVLTPGDVRVLVGTEDELRRRGEFERVFPSPVSSRYMRFFQRPRYLSLLLCQWEQRYCARRSQGVSLLRNLCQEGVHLSSASDPACTWTLESSVGQKLEPGVELSPALDTFISDAESTERDLPQRDL